MKFSIDVYIKNVYEPYISRNIKLLFELFKIIRKFRVSLAFFLLLSLNFFLLRQKT